MLDSNLEVVRKVSTRDISRGIRYSRKRVFAVVLDGTALGSIIRVCDENGVLYLGATNFGSFENAKVNLISL